MLKYAFGMFFLAMGGFEISLGLYAPLRSAILQTGVMGSKPLRPLVFVVLGCSALGMGLGLILYGSLW